MTLGVDPATPAHSLIGASGAARTLACTASVRLIKQVPLALHRSSIYADVGTALHAATAAIIADDLDPLSVIGQDFNGVVITREHVLDFIKPALSYVDPLLAAPGAEFLLDQRVQFPGIADAFGTLDCLIRIGNKVIVVDFKFGSGVTVRAVYPDAERGDLLNAQLLFYLAAARHSLPEFFRGADHFEIVILQPQTADSAEPVSATEVSAEEIEDFIAAFQEACRETCGPSPRLQRGDHCRFCVAKILCPLHTAPLLDLARFAVPAPTTVDSETYLQLLADGLSLVDATADIRKELHDQAKRALEAGDVVPGYGLSKGRAVRDWADASNVVSALIDLGLERADVLEETVRSPKQIEARAKSRGLKIPPEFIVSARSGVSLCRVENVRHPPPGRLELAQSFAAALQALKEGVKHV